VDFTPPSHDLTGRQREILHILAGGTLPLREILARLPNSPAPRTLRDDLHLLRRLGLAEFRGRGPAVIWYLHRSQPS